MRRRGFVIVTALTMLVALMAVLTAYFFLTRLEISNTRSIADSTAGFYAAEAGLNWRAERVTGLFRNYELPQGISPASYEDCVFASSSTQRNDFGCEMIQLQGRRIYTYLQPTTGVPQGQSTIVPAGSEFANLNATEFSYTLFSVALSPSITPVRGRPETIRPEAILSMGVKVRLIPMFQFAAFYDEDLELGPGPRMVLCGPVHTNSNLYLSSNDRLNILGQVTVGGNLYHGRKEGDPEVFNGWCQREGVGILRAGGSEDNPRDQDVVTLRGPFSRGVCGAALATNITDYRGNVRANNPGLPEGFTAQRVNLPQPDFLDPVQGRTYWDRADLRLVLNLPAGNALPTLTDFEVRRSNSLLDAAATNRLRACPGTIAGRAIGVTPASDTFTGARFYNTREQRYVNLIEVDMRAMLSCIQNNPTEFGFDLQDNTDGGLVFYFTINGPLSDVGCVRTATVDECDKNNYGVRIRNGAELVGGTTPVRGLTVVTNQAVYIWGDYNSINKRPAAFMADSLNILSRNWEDDDPICNGPTANRTRCRYGRDARDTTINAAFLAGTDITSAAQEYNGGLQNYPRFHEDWRPATLTYRGSLVSLDLPRYVNGPWTQQVYQPPRRNWDYDRDFNNPANLPPLTPRFVSLKQELFVREFEQAASR